MTLFGVFGEDRTCPVNAGEVRRLSWPPVMPARITELLAVERDLAAAPAFWPEGFGFVQPALAVPRMIVQGD